MSEVLPKAAAERAKLGFPVPIGHWLKGDAYGFADRLLRDGADRPVDQPGGGAAAAANGSGPTSPT